jgi:hypothetical protein
MKRCVLFIKLFLLTYVFVSCSFVSVKVDYENEQIEKDNIDSLQIVEIDKAKTLKLDLKNKSLLINIPPYTKIDTVIVDELNKTITVNFSKELSYISFRNENVQYYYNTIGEYLGEKYKGYKLKLTTLGIPIEDLIPNFYRLAKDYDFNRVRDYSNKRTTPIIENLNRQYKITKGLYNHNISIWHSHGWYYSVDANRWEWQRPRLFQTVEDLIPLSFVLPYIAPMLENAGANVFIPRERDYNINEVIVDNDSPSDIKNKLYIEYGKKGAWKDCNEKGFAVGNPPYEENFNPFLSGTAKYAITNNTGDLKIKWKIKVPESGEYCLYISYIRNESGIKDAIYSIKHAGGITNYKVNQTIGGNTWLFVGKFLFNKDDDNYVELTNKSSEVGKIITADAIRVGGGMGIVKRNGSTSGRPKFVEAAKYYLQYAGMPDTLIYNLNNNKNDYNDDYKSRTEYTNYLVGSPYGPNGNRNVKGLDIPIDLSIAFHTDAGITKNDTTVGTLAIYSLLDYSNNKNFPDGKSRLACRDLSDIIQTQIVDDIRFSYDKAWNKRQLREAQYAESQRPNVPALLLELLSHQNFLDMKYMLDPGFRFVVSRAIYKGILKYLAIQNNNEYVVQPLPIKDFYTEFNGEAGVKLSWNYTEDLLEPSAKPTGYVVYTSVDNKGFDNGVYVANNEYVIDKIEINKIYKFKVTAVNEGGESFPSEILAVCKTNSNKKALIVNAFDRISAPKWVDGENFSGFLSNLDAGVPDKVDLGFTGYQTDFNSNSPYISNDEPGHGASSANYETKVIAGNTFDYSFVHGEAFVNNGFSFVSCSNEAFEKGAYSLTDYDLIDIIAGEQKATPYPKKYETEKFGVRFKIFNKGLQNKITDYLASGGNIFISGAYLGTDVFRSEFSDSNDIKFAINKLKYNIASGFASKIGEVKSANNFSNIKFKFNTELNDKIYAVEAPDALLPVNGSQTLLRYTDNDYSAGIGYKSEYGVVCIGFPFETILEKDKRNELLKGIINFLKLDK